MKNFLSLLILLTFVACSTGGRDERFELKNYYTTGAYDVGLKFLEEAKFFKDKDQRLLYLFEKGMFLHSKGDYLGSNVVLEEAKSLSQELYTISISKKAQTAILNDNYDVFYGEVYERSMIYFYSSLNSIFQYQKDGNRDHMFHARADVLAWDSFLNSIKEDRLGKTVYKNDLLLKLYGAKIHELIGTREDDQIAILLYKDANDVLFKNYNTYLSFNSKCKDFKKDYEKLASMEEAEVKKKYISETDLQKSLKEYIASSLSNLTSKQKKNKEHLTVLLEMGVIAEKVADVTHFGLEGLSNDGFVSLFVADVLGMTPGRNSYNPGGVYAGMITASASMKLFTFSFELPKILNTKRPDKLFINVLDKDLKVVFKKEVSLVNPMGDIAEEAIYESSASLYARTGARLAAKHVAAIMASVGTYKALGGGSKQESFLAKNAAVLQYAAATRAIEASERADTRSWSTLPNEIRMIDLDLDPGEYTLELLKSDTTKSPLGKINVTKDNKEKLIEFRRL